MVNDTAFPFQIDVEASQWNVDLAILKPWHPPPPDQEVGHDGSLEIYVRNHRKIWRTTLIDIAKVRCKHHHGAIQYQVIQD